MQNCPNSRKNIWFHMFCQIFAEESEGGVWRVRNLVCREVRSCQENFLIYVKVAEDLKQFGVLVEIC